MKLFAYALSRGSVVAAAALAAALTAACATTAPAPSAPVAAAPVAAPQVRTPARRIGTLSPAVEVAPRDRIRKTVDLLGRGQRLQARAEVALLLSEQPASATARSLLDQIDKDPKALLGERSYVYKVRPGETLSLLADRFLGDPLMFYALARYNGIDVPDSSEVGRTLRIPGVPKVAVAPAPQTARAARPATVAAGADPARASGLRRTALEAMNKGSIDQAVALLRQAQPLDPANPAIRTDLDRALRIQASLRNR
jgi:hypothetical protein